MGQFSLFGHYYDGGIPLFFKAAAAENGVSAADSTAYLGYTIAAATFILGMLGPVLGTIADYKGCKKRFFAFFF
ncbi:hypothetical protein QNN00_04800 [Bacillus velezensis]|nr:hypothetical protein [Bacillus velezensis]